jgi:arginyl-tRNA synthetase
LPKNIEKIEMAGAGFLNFFLSKEFYKDFLENFSFDEKKGEKILLEHTSTNLFKPFHIGHLVNNSLGESIGRILKFSGNEVEVISFPSDVSPGIAKTI